MKKIIIIGLGSGDYKQLTLSALEQLKSADVLIMRTEKHPTVDYIQSLGISFTNCDDVYDTQQTFEDTYKKICERVLESCIDGKTLVYAVPGHPLVAEKSVELILEMAKEGFEVDIVPAVSFIDSILTALRIDPAYGLKIIDGLSLDIQKPDFNCGNIITQVYSKFIASEIKLKLMELYKDDTEICIIRAAGVKDLERIERHPLYELDRIDWVDYLTSVYIPPVTDGARFKTMNELVDLMVRLRGEGGCPWDREQTRESLKTYLLEETYEVLDAIEKDDIDLLMEELGDLLLQVVFHAQIANEAGEFDIHDVITGIVKKLVERHPHVFGDVIATTESGALKSWEASKRKLKGITTYTQTLTDIPETLPNLMRSYKIQEKAALVGFDWDDVKDAIAKIDEELQEVKEVYNTGNKSIIEEEIGDLLFSVVNVARFLKIQPELALKTTIEKFINRFRYIEETALQNGNRIDKMTLQEMDKLWNQAKDIKLLQK